MILSTEITGSWSSALQILVPIQHAFSAVLPGERQSAPRLTDEDARRLQRRLEAYEQRFAAMSIHIADLEKVNAELSGIRQRGMKGGRLLPARIVAGDSLPWRASKLLDRGTLTGVTRNSAVISRRIVADGMDHAELDGMSVITSEALVGEIAPHLGTHTSRLLLMTDPAASRRLVRIARESGGELHSAPHEYLIQGIGDNKMEIRGVHRDDIESGTIRKGDRVLSTATDQRLPFSVMIGTVADIRADDDNGVLCNLIVEPAVQADALRRVYVVDVLR